jgi:fused signal recognition particle receptor
MIVALLALVIVALVVIGVIGFTVTRSGRDSARRPIEPQQRPEASASAQPGSDTAVIDRDFAPPSATPDVTAVAPVEAKAPEVAPEVEPEAAAVTEPEPIVRARLRDRLGKTRGALSGYLRGLAGRGIDDEVYEELEEALILADVGVVTANRLLGAVRESAAATKARDADEVVALLRSEIESLLTDGVERSLRTTPGRTSVWLFVGVNGVGKTTTIGKLAAQHIAEGDSVMLAAGDTFRAAAAEQLAQWAQRTGAAIVRGDEGADPGAIVFDAMAAATSRHVDLLLVDTAGRLHTKHNLMAELEKLRRIVERTEGALHEVLLVIDATTGQNGMQQARQFADAVDVSGIALTKLDGTAKGGIVLAIQAELGIPVKLVGVGETMGDLIEFDPKDFTAGLFDVAD